MGLQLRKGREGALRRHWYGEFRRANGTRAVVNLNVEIEGTPPALGLLSERGDPAFERSRNRALAALEAMREQERKGRATKAEALRMYRERTGEPLRAVLVDDLVTARADEQHKRGASWVRFENHALQKFVEWLHGKNIGTVLEVSTSLAREYLSKIYSTNAPQCTARTARAIKGVLARAFDRTLPDGAANPFRHPTLRIRAVDGDQEYHRTPLTPDEVGKVLATAAATDPQAHDWIVCALSTGLRRGDVCRMKWEDVDLSAGALRLRTSKTGAELHLPIMPLLQDVLTRRKAIADDSPFVFPEAEAMMHRNDVAITKRVKKVFALALHPREDAPHDGGVYKPLAEVLDTVMKVVEGASMTPTKRQRMTRVLQLYAAGKTYREMAADTGLSKGGISGLLQEAETASGIRFIRRQRQPGEVLPRDLIARVTRTTRAVGTKAASVYDFHALRTTFVTLAISAGVNVDKLRALTGHATVDLVMRHYFKPKGTDFADELRNALPKILTTTQSTKRKHTR